MTRAELTVTIQNYIGADGVLYGLDDLARLLEQEIKKADTRGYFRAMRDIQSRNVAQLNSI